jgi:hypothetical protein
LSYSVSFEGCASEVKSAGARPAIFEEDWWLDASAPGAWDRVEVMRNGVTLGEMTFHVQRRWGLTFIKMPHLTRTMSPRLMIPSREDAVFNVDAQAVVGDLVGKLPRHDRFERALRPGCPSVQGFVHAGMAVTHLFTFRSHPGDNPEAMLQRADRETRRIVTKAARECGVERSTDIDRFIRVHRLAWGDASLAHYPTVERIYAAAAARGRAEILFITARGADAAAAILVWDSDVAYTWLLARNREHTGASSLLFFEGMRTAHRLGRILDFDGYIRPEVGKFLMGFGLQPTVRPYVNGASPLWACCRAATSLVSPARGDRHYRVF